MKKRIPSTTLAARVRAYFGLNQDDLAQYLGVTRGAVSHMETRRNDVGTTVWLRLLTLAASLPPADEPAAPTAAELAPEAPGTLEEVPVRLRLLECQREARLLCRTLEAQHNASQYVQRWQQALPALQAALPDPPTADSQWQQRQRRWLATHTTDIADKLAVVPLTEYRLLQLRLHLLETEATELCRWLAGTNGTNDPLLPASSPASTI
jgi:DNA-binding XRE family transcriptional regulator